MMSKKKLAFVIPLVLCLGLVSYVIASYWVYSTQIGVTITKFDITLGDPGGSYAPGETVTFTGQLYKVGVGGLNGYTVYIEYYDGDSWEYTGSSGGTSGGGYFSINYVIPDGWSVGTVQFRSKAQVP